MKYLGFFVFFLFPCALANASPAVNKEQWCSSGINQGEGESIIAYDLLPVQLNSWRLASNILNQRSIVRLDPASYEQFGVSTQSVGQRTVYLVRGSVAINQDGQAADAFTEAMNSRNFSLKWSGSTGVILMSIQTIAYPFKEVKVPMVLITSQAFDHAYLSCWRMG